MTAQETVERAGHLSSWRSTSLWRALRSRTTWIVAAAVVTLLVAAAAADDEFDLPYDPESAALDGTKGLVLLLQQLDTRVEMSDHVDGDTVLVLGPFLSEAQTREVDDWVRAGGVLVTADPPPQLAVSRLSAAGVGPRTLEAECRSPYVDGVGRIAPHHLRNYAVLDPVGAAVNCFPTSEGVFMVAQEHGLGTIVELGDPYLFTNQELHRADNAVLAANLLAGTPGSRLIVLQPRLDLAEEDGQSPLAALIPESVEQSFWQIALAAALLALWRGRRLGKPVHEAHRVELPASSLVVAVGDLLQTAGHVETAARTLRRGLRRSIGDRLGVPEGTDPNVLVALAAARTRIDQRRLREALLDAPVGSRRGLLELSQLIEDVHREVAHVR